MNKAPSIPTRLTTWRRFPAIVGLVALALLHVSAATHKFEHSAEHNLGLCEACATYSQLEDSAIPCAPGEDVVIAPNASVSESRADDHDTPFAANYRCRAPPLS